ncbi:hypothetical protein N8T08_004788 [Aspergillus melleus]|uniref:Uncharacterized protein n=1 Tax=Aspergillus melleus TaxID=138277 RepID=A0ACC3B2Z8_9EURO|nr:hypothetical protein N8T08_004788 [Aspergillus melleus]
MRGRQTDALRLIQSESDDERKPSLSPDSPDPASTMVVAQSPPIFGPDRPFPSHIVDLLKEYHRHNGPRPPQFAYKGRPSSPSKVFDRQGKEVDLSLFSIVEPCPYRVLVLRRPGVRDTLVACHLPYSSKYGTYLMAWMGVEKGYETDCCAVRIFNRDLNAIRFSHQVWTALDDMRMKSQGVTQTTDTTLKNKRVETPRSSRATGVNGAANSRSANTSTNRNTEAANKTATSMSSGNGHAGTDSGSEYETYSGTDDSSEEETSDEEEVVSLPPAKKVKTAPETPTARSTQGSAVFKLVSYKSGAIRCFPLEECKTGKDLFQKARDFFRLFDRKVDVKILSCQISSRPEQHYLFEGSEGEFALLVEQVKGTQAGGRCTVEIGHVLSC